MLRRGGVGAPITALLVFSLFLLAGCSASQQYPGDKKSGTYFTAPVNWRVISQSQLSSYESHSSATGAAERLSEVLWQEALSSNQSTAAADVFSLRTPSAPIAYVRVRSLSVDEINAISYNQLRDAIYPLTSWLDGTTTPPKNFTLLDDLERVEKGARGVQSIFSLTGSDGQLEYINQTALVSNDRSTMYILLVRCSQNEFEKSKKEIESIASSFTVRGNQ
jgi:hypothetical protein